MSSTNARRFFALFLFLTLLPGEGRPQAAVNEAPRVTITSPQYGALFNAPAAVQVRADASDADGQINRVEFYLGATKIGESRSAPFLATTGSLTPGSYLLTAVATDNLGATVSSRAIPLTVDNSGVTVPSLIQFSAATSSVDESAGTVTLTVRRLGAANQAATVDYATIDLPSTARCGGTTATTGAAALARCDYASTAGTLAFAPGETEKTLTISITNDTYSEGPETFSVALARAVNSTLDPQSVLATVTINDNETGAPASNPILAAPFFVRQHYIDFLSREPEPAGFDAWLRVLNNCAIGDPRCDRIEVSSSFFRSTEFQERGYFVYRFYEASLGRRPQFEEFLPDMLTLSGAQTPAAQEANRAALASSFVARPEFRAKYDALAAADYVATIAQTAGIALANQSQLTADLLTGRKTRAEVLREIVETREVYTRFFNRGFVTTEYFGYLRRDPERAGFDAWVAYLDRTGDYRTLVNGFVNSLEYQFRFGCLANAC